MNGIQPTLEGLNQVLEMIAADPRIPANFPGWIRSSLRTSGWKIQALRTILSSSPPNGGLGATSSEVNPSLLDVGAQFGALAIYAAQLGCRVSAVDYGPYAGTYGEIAADHGVDYRECDVGAEALPFPDNTFNFVTYTDVIEHHPFSPKRTLREINRVLAPGGRVILLTPNHASIYNRANLLLGRSVNDEFDYFFNTCANDKVYDGHHREYTRSEIRAALQQTQFCVLECRVVEQDFAAIRYALRQVRARSQSLSATSDLLLCALGKLWMTLRLPFGRWIYAIGEKARKD